MTQPREREAGVGLRFALEIDTAADLAHDADRVDALLTVHARRADGVSGDTSTAEILIMDRSQSMASHGKIGEAKRAVYAAIDAVRDGALLGIVAGNHEPETVYPERGTLAPVDDTVRAAAKRRVHGLLPVGGTAIGSWLVRAGELFAESTGAGTVCHAALYTDGRNEHETAEELERALQSCSDRFVCDVRGLGDDWNHAELLRIAEALHGEAKAVDRVADLTADFARLMARAPEFVVPRVYLGLRRDNRFRIGFVRQTRPVIAELTARQQGEGPEVHVPLGSWAAESREFHLSLRFDPQALPVGEDLRAARITLLAELPDGTRAQCCDSQPLVVRRHPAIGFVPSRSLALTQVENEQELGIAMRACVNAYLAGRLDQADRELRRALRLARELGDGEQLRLLESVAELDERGEARVRRGLGDGQLQRLGINSIVTSALPRALADLGSARAGDGAVARVCPRCGETTSGPVVKICENCGWRLDDPAAAS